MDTLTRLTQDNPNSSALKQFHLDYLDSLRALAAIYVLLFHAQGQMQGVRTGISKYLPAIFGFGHYAVDLFIVISGFCLALPVVQKMELRGGAIKFFKRRARRILPPYYLTLALSLILIATVIGHKTGTIWDNALPVTKSGVITHLVLTQDAFSYSFSQINHSLWSISVEWRIYFLFPLIIWLWKRLGIICASIVICICSYFLLLALRHFLGTDLTSQYIGLFSLGMLGAGISFSDNGTLRHWRQCVPWLFMFILGIPLIIFISHKGASGKERLPQEVCDYIVGAWSMSLLIAVQQNQEGLIGKILNWKPLVFIGSFSYSIYLMHAPLLQILWQYVFHPLNLSPFLTYLLQCCIGTPIIIILCYIFFIFAERPFLSRPTLQQSLLKGRAAA